MTPRPVWMPEDGDAHRARRRDCPTCRQPVWVGVDVDNALTPTVTDTTPVPDDTVERVAALLAGRRLYTLTPCKGGHELAGVDDFGFTEARWPVLPEHQCTSDTLEGT